MNSRVAGPKEASAEDASLISWALSNACQRMAPGAGNSPRTWSTRLGSKKLSKTMCGNGFALMYVEYALSPTSLMRESGRKESIVKSLIARITHSCPGDINFSGDATRPGYVIAHGL